MIIIYIVACVVVGMLLGAFLVVRAIGKCLPEPKELLRAMRRD